MNRKEIKPKNKKGQKTNAWLLNIGICFEKSLSKKTWVHVNPAPVSFIRKCKTCILSYPQSLQDWAYQNESGLIFRADHFAQERLRSSLPVSANLKISSDALFLSLNSILTMFKQVLALTLALAFLIACKSEHPDLKTAYELFKEGFEQHSYIITHSAELKNEAKMVDSRIRNEDKESVFAISEVYNHLDEVDGGLKNLVGRIQAVPGHEKESFGAPVLDKKMEPAQILMIQKNYRDSVLLIKNELDAAATLLNALKTKLN